MAKTVVEIPENETKEERFIRIATPRVNAVIQKLEILSNYYVLKSYNTFIACIHKSSDILFDGLRIVYGYTSTSGQHIRKFSKDYGKAKYGVTHIMTGRCF